MLSRTLKLTLHLVLSKIRNLCLILWLFSFHLTVPFCLSQNWFILPQPSLNATLSTDDRQPLKQNKSRLLNIPLACGGAVFLSHITQVIGKHENQIFYAPWLVLRERWIVYWNFVVFLVFCFFGKKIFKVMVFLSTHNAIHWHHIHIFIPLPSEELDAIDSNSMTLR